MRQACCKPKECKITVIFARNGESEWYPQNLFCGWVDVNLTSNGKEDAATAGKLIKQSGYKFDIAYTSLLSRANEALQIILKEIDQADINIERSWQLNERHYGALTGLNKAGALERYKEEDVKKWRTSYDIPPPPIEEDHAFHKAIVEDSKYANIFTPESFPKSESLKMAHERCVSYWKETIGPRIREGKRVLIVAHGNSLRGIIKHLDNKTDQDILNIYLPTTVPFCYTLDRNLNPATNGNLNFLGDPETAKKALEEMAAQVNINSNTQFN